jgi:hypothetical protein
MTEIEQQTLSSLLSNPAMQKALEEVAATRKKSDMDSIEKAALSQAYNVGLLAGLNGLLEVAKIKQTLSITPKKLKYES